MQYIQSAEVDRLIWHAAMSVSTLRLSVRLTRGMTDGLTIQMEGTQNDSLPRLGDRGQEEGQG